MDKKGKSKSDITYHNKDVLSKVMAENFKDKSLKVYGIDVPKIKQVLPTNLPEIQVNEMRIDNLFLLEDGTYAIVDYESVYKRINKIKYLNYIARVMEKYYIEDDNFNLRLIVIYTGDADQAEPDLKTACFTLHAEQAFLAHIDGKAAFQEIQEKLQAGRSLDKDDLMKLVILPLTVPGTEGKQEMLEAVVGLAEQLEDEEQQVFILSGVVVASDKFIQKEYMEQIRRKINMTQIGQMYEKEKIEYGNQKVREVARAMLDEGIDIVKVMKITGLTEDELLRLRDTAVTV